MLGALAWQVKVPNKSIYFWCWERSWHGVLPGSPLFAFLVSFFPALFSPASNNSASISGYLSLNRPCDTVVYFEASPIQGQVTHVELRYAQHGDGYKQRFYCRTILESFGRGTLCRQV